MKSITVLVAGDNEANRRQLSGALTDWGYQAVDAHGGHEACESLTEEGGPRLAVLDSDLTGLSGIEVCRRLKAGGDEQGVYVILVLPNSDRATIQAAAEAGADDFLARPYDHNELKARVRAGTRILELQAKLQAVQEACRTQAARDSVTGLPNRLLFGDRLSEKLKRAKRLGNGLAVLFLDLDQFKLINDTLGHSAGDRLLQAVSERLQATLREMDTIARMGGDEFAMILTDFSDEQAPGIVAGRVLATLCRPFDVDGHEHFITGSMGISIFPTDGEDAETLVRNADIAMYRAKELGSNTFQMFRETMNAAALERMEIEKPLRSALQNGEFDLHYQVRVNLASNEVQGAEALLRWKSPRFGLLLPGRFIKVAEQSGVLQPITGWAIHEACSRNKSWIDAGFRPMDVAVNISPRSFHRLDLVKVVHNRVEESRVAVRNVRRDMIKDLREFEQVVHSALKRTGLDPERLTLEITENTVMNDADATIGILSQLKDTGIRISIDDFGTGYSSLSYLKGLPIDNVKIDCSFIRHVTSDPDDAAIVRTIISMAHSLRLTVTAEGVERLDQLEFLRELSCDEVQGYFISKPVPHDEVLSILRNGLPPLTRLLTNAA